MRSACIPSGRFSPDSRWRNHIRVMLPCACPSSIVGLVTITQGLVEVGTDYGDVNYRNSLNPLGAFGSVHTGRDSDCGAKASIITISLSEFLMKCLSPGSK